MQDNNEPTPRYRKRGEIKVPETMPEEHRDFTVRSKGTVKIGKVTLPINAEPHPKYVPTEQYIVGCEDIMEAMALAVAQRKPVLLKGETGTGKTTLVHELAHKTNNAVRQINLNGNTTVDEIVGRTMLNREGTYFIDGILISAMKHGHWILLDELNAGLPEVLLVLQQVLVDGRYTLVENDGEIIEAHPNFRVFATMNPPETYVGTNHLNPATLSRFGITIEVDYPAPEMELAIVKSKLPSTPRTPEAEMIEAVRLAGDVRNGYAQQEYAYLLSTRDLINWLEVNEHYGDLVQSAQYTILGKCNADDRQALSSILKVYFSAPIEVHPSDGTFDMVYKKGNLFQVCDDNLEIYNARNNDLIGKAKAGALFEVMQVKNNAPIVRILKGEVLEARSNAGSVAQLSHDDMLKIGELRKVSTRRIDSKTK